MDAGLNIIVAVAKNGVIGKNNDLPWKLKSDLRRFAQITKNHIIIAGRKTHESIIKRLGQNLPNRITIVVTRQLNYDGFGATTVKNLEKAIRLAKIIRISDQNKKIFIIGGGEIFNLAQKRAKMVYLTRVQTELEGDTFFPELDTARWQLIHSEKHQSDRDNEFDYEFQTYERKN